MKIWSDIKADIKAAWPENQLLVAGFAAVLIGVVVAGAFLEPDEDRDDVREVIGKTLSFPGDIKGTVIAYEGSDFDVAFKSDNGTITVARMSGGTVRRQIALNESASK